MYAGWSAPGKLNNADNPVLLDKSFFDVSKYAVQNF